MLIKALLVFFLIVSVVSALPLQGRRTAANQTDCGVSKVLGATPYIVGGTGVQKGQYPWMASLLYMGISHICGATVINDRWLLTAAHCFAFTQSKIFMLSIGGSLVSDYEDSSETYFVETFISHEKFNPSQTKYDIALLKTTKPINFNNPFINRVCLPQADPYEIDDKQARIIGWGDLKDATGNNMPQTMQQADIKIQPVSACSAVYEGFDDASQICAKGATTATCSGDSGGPMHVLDENGAFVQAGVISFVGSSGCLSEQPNVFTRVSAYLDWIEKTMAANA